VLFTKFDALYDDEFAELMSKGVSRKDAEALAPQHAKEAFANGPQLKLLYNRKGNQRPPRCHICLPGKSTNSRAANQFAAYPRTGTFRYGQGWCRLRAPYRTHSWNFEWWHTQTAVCLNSADDLGVMHEICSRKVTLQILPIYDKRWLTVFRDHLHCISTPPRQSHRVYLGKPTVRS